MVYAIPWLKEPQKTFGTMPVPRDLAMDLHGTSAALVGLQVLGFNLMALLTGWMVDRQRCQRQERDFIKETFGRYVSKRVRDEILAGRISLKGEIKDVTVQFADLRGFTRLAQDLNKKLGTDILLSDAVQKKRAQKLRCIQ